MYVCLSIFSLYLSLSLYIYIYIHICIHIMYVYIYIYIERERDSPYIEDDRLLVKTTAHIIAETDYITLYYITL